MIESQVPLTFQTREQFDLVFHDTPETGLGFPLPAVLETQYVGVIRQAVGYIGGVEDRYGFVDCHPCLCAEVVRPVSGLLRQVYPPHNVIFLR